MPVLLGAADIGIAFKQNSFAQTACSPTKLGEMMAMGIPVIVNRGVGDVDSVIDDTGAGVVVDRFDRQAMVEAVEAAEHPSWTRDRIRAGAERWFRLERGVAAYDSLYRSATANRMG